MFCFGFVLFRLLFASAGKSHPARGRQEYDSGKQIKRLLQTDIFFQGCTHLRGEAGAQRLMRGFPQTKFKHFNSGQSLIARFFMVEHNIILAFSKRKRLENLRLMQAFLLTSHPAQYAPPSPPFKLCGIILTLSKGEGFLFVLV